MRGAEPIGERLGTRMSGSENSQAGEKLQHLTKVHKTGIKCEKDKTFLFVFFLEQEQNKLSQKEATKLKRSNVCFVFFKM